MQVIDHLVDLAAPPERVWQTLTDPKQMSEWAGEPEMKVEVATDWVVGGPITIDAFHHVKIRSWGTVLHFEPPSMLRYTQLSSISRLPDVPSSYSTIELRLAPSTTGTRLSVQVTGFPTESIHRHLALYWRGTLAVLKRRIEDPATPLHRAVAP